MQSQKKLFSKPNPNWGNIFVHLYKIIFCNTDAYLPLCIRMVAWYHHLFTCEIWLASYGLFWYWFMSLRLTTDMFDHGRPRVYMSKVTCGILQITVYICLLKRPGQCIINIYIQSASIMEKFVDPFSILCCNAVMYASIRKPPVSLLNADP